MAVWNVSFAVTGKFIAAIQAATVEKARESALAAFFAAVRRASADGTRLAIDPEKGVATSALAIEQALEKAGAGRVDWQAVGLLLDTIEEEFTFAVEKDALAVVRAAVAAAKRYPEDMTFTKALAIEKGRALERRRQRQ